MQSVYGQPFGGQPFGLGMAQGMPFGQQVPQGWGFNRPAW
jgi:hypothetical protein